MFTHISYQSENHPLLEKCCLLFGLESPSKSTYVNSDELIQFSGWIIPSENDFVVFDVYQDGAIIDSIEPNMPRIDVAQHHNILSDYLNFGFSFKLKASYNYKIFVRTTNNNFCLWSLDKIEDHRFDKFDEIHNQWVEFHSTRNDSTLSSYSIETLKLYFDTFIITSCADDVIYIANCYCTTYNRSFNIEKLQMLSAQIKDPTWVVKRYKDCIDTGMLLIDSPFSEAKAYCFGSITISDFNFLLFYDDNDEFFYICQHCANISIIIPKIRCILSTSVYAWVNHSKKMLPELFVALSKLAPKKFSIAKFSGLVLSQRRPYHYFYDYIHGLQIISESGYPLSKTPLYIINNHAFLDVSGIYFDMPAVMIDYQDLNVRIMNENKFLLSPSIQYSEVNDLSIIKRLDSIIIDSVSSLFEGVSLKEYYPIIWLGLSQEKRYWLEQRNGFNSIIKMIKKSYPNMAVVIDGITSPISSNAESTHMKYNDTDSSCIIDENKDIRIINLIGSDAATKIFYANECDLFISSYATDSMYPSRICSKKGIVYAPSTIGEQKKLHIHYDVHEVPPEHVKSQVSFDGTIGDWSTTNVSIDISVMCDIVKNILNSSPLRQVQ